MRQTLSIYELYPQFPMEPTCINLLEKHLWHGFQLSCNQNRVELCTILCVVSSILVELPCSLSIINPLTDNSGGQTELSPTIHDKLCLLFPAYLLVESFGFFLSLTLNWSQDKNVCSSTKVGLQSWKFNFLEYLGQELQMPLIFQARP